MLQRSIPGYAASLEAIGSLAAAPLLNAFSARWVILGTGAVVLAEGLFWVRPALQGRRWPGTEPLALGGSPSA